jgi:hypothetical protein
VQTASGQNVYAAGEPMRWAGKPAPESRNYAFRKVAFSTGDIWQWGIRCAGAPRLGAERGVIAGERMGCPRTYAYSDYWCQGGAFRHGGRDGRFPGGNVLFSDGAARWCERAEGFGVFGKGTYDYVITFFSAPWRHWYRYNHGAQESMPSLYPDYE